MPPIVTNASLPGHPYRGTITNMKWLVAIALVVASASIVVPALLRNSEAKPADTLDRIHELAAF